MANIRYIRTWVLSLSGRLCVCPRVGLPGDDTIKEITLLMLSLCGKREEKGIDYTHLRMYCQGWNFFFKNGATNLRVAGKKDATTKQ